MQSHSALKQHTSELEEALAEKESSIVDITARTQQELVELGRHSTSTQQKIAHLEQETNKQKDEIRELKKQVLTMWWTENLYMRFLS